MIKDITNRLGYIENIDKKQPARTEIIQQIVARQLFRTRQDVKDWRDALRLAEDIQMPSRHRLMKVYEDVILDGHITGIIKSIKNKVKSKEFMIVDENGDEDEDKTKLFKKKWYFKFMDHIIEAPFFGYSLVQLGTIENDGFPNMKLVPRENVIPELEIVKKDIFNSTTTSKNAFFYNKPPLKDWLIYIGDADDNMGWLNSASPHALSKKNLFMEMWQYGELFGMPIRQGHTDINDANRRKNMEEMMERMGSAAWGVFDRDDTITFIESSKSDAKVFIEPIQLSNDEISKGFAGQVAVFDEKAFVGSAEVQERLFQDFIVTFMRQAMFVMNDDLLPRMVIHGILPEGFSFKWKAEETMSAEKKASIITGLSKFYDFTPEVVGEAIGIPVENIKITPVKEEPDAPTSRMKEVEALYKGF